MSKPSRLIAAAALAVAIAVPAFLYAAAGAHGSDPSAAGFSGHFVQHIAKQLNLTADQQDKLKAVFTAHKDQIHTQMTQLHQAHTNLSNAVQADAFDEGAIRAAATALGQAEGDAAVLHAQMFAEVRQLLTPDQQAKAKELMLQHHQNSGQWFEHMHQHSQGDSSNPSQR